MVTNRIRSGWVSALTAALGALLFLTACSSTTTVVVATTPPPAPSSEDDDYSTLVAQLRSDLSRFNARHIEKTPVLTAVAETKKERDKEFATRAKALFAPVQGTALFMPV